jgi:hypothetical protein
MLGILIFHWFLALILFFGVNWVGGHARSVGYISLTLFVQRDNAPAFNALFRLVSPVVFLTIVAALLYLASLDNFVKNIWHVAVYSVVIRLGYNVLVGRALLLNWPKEILVNGLCIGLTWLTYDRFIQHKKTLLPDFSTATNELWVFIGVFLYLVFNSVDTGTRGSERRKSLYLRVQEEKFRRLYGHILDVELPDDFSHSIAMSILIYESFNRPRVVQGLERLIFPRFSKTLGPMQVTTTKTITDFESVTLGCQKIAASYQNWKAKADKDDIAEGPNEWRRRYTIVRGVAADYNRDSDYVSDLETLQGTVMREFYSARKAISKS